MVRQFVDVPTGPGGVAAGGASAEFDDIIGTSVATGGARPADPARASAAPSAPRRPVARQRGGRRTALAAMGGLAVAGIALAGAMVISADLIAHGPLTAPDTKLASDAGAASEVVPATGTPYGSAAAIGDQLAVTISEPIAYTPAPGSTGADTGVDVVSTVTVTNTSAGSADPRLAFAPIGTPAVRILDKAQGVRLNSVGSIEPGQSITYRIAFAAQNASKLALEVTSADGETIVYRD